METADQYVDEAPPRKNARRDAAQQRMCAVLREPCDPADLIRFAAGPDGAIVPDLKRKLPGRGVWLTASIEIVEKAAKKNVFARSLKQQVSVRDDLPQLVEELLAEDTRQSLAMVNKAGLLVSGAFQVEKLVGKGTIGALIQASDARPDGVRKIEQVIFRHLGPAAEQVEKVDIFDSAQLSLALGQTNVIHAALKQGAATEAFLIRARRLAKYRGQRLEPQPLKAHCDAGVQVAEVEDK